MDFSTFQARLRSLIESRGIYIYALAEDLGVSVPTVHRYLSGKRTPDLIYVVRIAQYFDVSVDWLLGVSDNKHDVFSKEATEVASLYSLASEDDRRVVQAVLWKYKNKE